MISKRSTLLKPRCLSQNVFSFIAWTRSTTSQCPTNHRRGRSSCDPRKLGIFFDSVRCLGSVADRSPGPGWFSPKGWHQVRRFNEPYGLGLIFKQGTTLKPPVRYPRHPVGCGDSEKPSWSLVKKQNRKLTLSSPKRYPVLVAFDPHTTWLLSSFFRDVFWTDDRSFFAARNPHLCVV